MCLVRGNDEPLDVPVARDCSIYTCVVLVGTSSISRPPSPSDRSFARNPRNGSLREAVGELCGPRKWSGWVVVVVVVSQIRDFLHIRCLWTKRFQLSQRNNGNIMWIFDWCMYCLCKFTVLQLSNKLLTKTDLRDLV